MALPPSLAHKPVVVIRCRFGVCCYGPLRRDANVSTICCQKGREKEALFVLRGALLHYSRVLRGAYDHHPLVRESMTRIFAQEGKASFLKYFADTSVGVGTAIGVLAALPFIPGMLGSPKATRVHARAERKSPSRAREA